MFGKACAASLAALALTAATPPVPAAVAMASADEQRNASSGSAGAAAEPAKADRKICKNFPDTVSRMRTRRLCLTQAEWREFEDAQQ